MDAAKTVAAMAANPKNYGGGPVCAQHTQPLPLPVFACPTTAGTGSEVNAYAVLTTGHGEHTHKAGYTNVQAMPAMSFLDAKYTMNLPKTVSLSTAMDAIAHAVEAYLHKSSGVFSRMVSMETLRLVWPNFCKLQREELTFEQREQLLFGAGAGRARDRPDRHLLPAWRGLSPDHQFRNPARVRLRLFPARFPAVSRNRLCGKR